MSTATVVARQRLRTIRSVTQVSGMGSEADVRVLHWTALVAADRAVRNLRTTDLDRTTPCHDLTARAVLRHIVGHNRGLAAQLEGRPHDPGIWAGLDLGLDPRLHWWDSARRVVAASSARSDLSGHVAVPGLGSVQLARALGIHAADLLAHTWDLTVTCESGPVVQDDPYQQALQWLDAHGPSWLDCTRLAPSAVETGQGPVELLTRLGRAAIGPEAPATSAPTA